MEPVNHIRELLYHHDCVVVPGFGGFVTNQRAARIDRASGSFYPPSRLVGFNARIDHNDGLLISHISSRLSLNYVDAKKLVDKFVGGVKDSLVAGRSVHFEGIGQFVVDRNHNLQFEPDPAANFLTEAYGLSFFRYPELSVRRPAGKLRQNQEEEESSPLRVSVRKMLRYAAIGIPLIAALTWGAMNTGTIREFSFDLSTLNPFSAVVDSGSGHTSGYNTSSGSGVPSGTVAEGDIFAFGDEEPDPGIPEPETGEVPGTEGLQSAGAEPYDISAQPGPASLPVRSHFIVAGSFTRQNNALSMSRELENDGYNTTIIESDNGLYRVSMYSTQNRREALQMLRKLRADQGSSEIWMLSM